MIFHPASIRQLARTFVVAMLLGRVSGAAELNPNQDPSSPSRAAGIGLLLGETRGEALDRIALSNGETITGTLLNSRVQLASAFGPLDFETSMLSGIVFGAAGDKLDYCVSVNCDRLSGFLQDRVFRFRVEQGEEINVRRERISKIILRTRPNASAGGGSFCALENGDFFTARVLTDPLPILVGASNLTVLLKDVQTFVKAGDERVKLILKSQQTISGQLAIEDISVRLPIGVELKIYRDEFQSIDGRHDYFPDPQELPQLARFVKPNRSFGMDRQLSADLRKRLVLIPAGVFVMGSPTSEKDRGLDEGPATEVRFAKAFWMGKFEVTQAEYERLMGANPSQFTGDTNRPVEKVNWHEAMEYCARLTRHAMATGNLPDGYVYRLPTEAEWEYACRAGTTTRLSYGDDPEYALLESYAWFNGNAGSTTHPVGEKKPNPWGLHDMHGNVWEWCFDRSNGSLPGGAVANFSGPTEGSLRVARGGSWLYDGKFCRSANRDDYGPSNRCSDIGFRVVLAPAVP